MTIRVLRVSDLGRDVGGELAEVVLAKGRSAEAGGNFVRLWTNPESLHVCPLSLKMDARNEAVSQYPSSRGAGSRTLNAHQYQSVEAKG